MRFSRLLFSTLAGCLLTALTNAAEQGKQPNFVFIVSEDNSVHYLRLYGHKLGVTPNIERLAAEGLTFNHAFSGAPVCSVARTTLATAMHAPRVGFQYHRKSALASLPPGVKPWSTSISNSSGSSHPRSGPMARTTREPGGKSISLSRRTRSLSASNMHHGLHRSVSASNLASVACGVVWRVS